MLAYKKDWNIIDDSYAFLNAILLIVILITGKWIWKNKNFIAFLFGQHYPFHTKIDKFNLVIKESCCLWVFSPRIWNVSWMPFFRKKFTASYKSMEWWPRDIWLSGITSVLKDFLGSNTVKLIFKSFFSCLLRKVLSSLFSIKYFTYYLFHKLILYFVLLILKHMFKSTCIYCTRLSDLIYMYFVYHAIFEKTNKVSIITIVFAICTESR